MQLPSMMSLTRTGDQGVDPMTTTSSTVDQTDTRATAGSHTSSAEDEAYTTDNRGELVSPQTAGFWPNSNQTAVDVNPVRAGCSRAPKGNDSPASKDTDAILKGMTYVGGMNYAKYRLEACRAKASGKQKMRPPALCVQDELSRENASSYRDGVSVLC